MTTTEFINEPIEAWTRCVNDRKEWCVRNLRTPDDELEFCQTYGDEYVEKMVHATQTNNAFIESGKQCYSLDPDFLESIVNEKWVDLLPDTIEYAPHHCFYVKAPVGKCDGFIVRVVNVADSIDEQFDLEADDLGKWVSSHLCVRGVHILDDPKCILISDGARNWTLFAYCLYSNFDDEGAEWSDADDYPYHLLPNCVAYICSKNADIVSHVSTRKKKSRRSPARRKPTWHKVGYRIGSELRKYKRHESDQCQRGTGGKVRPHVRRAHWHHYWVGPSTERRLVLKWLAPIIVAAKDEQIDSVTEHHVPSTKANKSTHGGHR